MFFCFNDTATTEIYTLSLHDALPICNLAEGIGRALSTDYFQLREELSPEQMDHLLRTRAFVEDEVLPVDRKSTRLNSSHANISYAVFCLNKKTVELHPGHSPVSCVTL